MAIAVAACVASSASARSPSESREAERGASPASASIRFYQRYISDLRLGRCAFEPSCSQYALDAIDEHGVFKGAALAADRLVRCHGGARAYYETNSKGKLVDSARERSGAGRRPEIPAWLLPPPVAAYEIEGDPASDSGSIERKERLIEIKAIAGALSDEGDCFRAATEYRRFAFLENGGEASWWSRMMIGRCHFQRNEWKTAASEYAEAASRALDPAGRSSAKWMEAAAQFNAGGFGRALTELDAQAPVDRADSTRADFLRGLCLLALGDWSESRALFRGLAGEAQEPAAAKGAFYLSRRAEEGPGLPRKNAALAGMLSAAIPGAGQVYAGRTRDGLRHLVFDGLLVYTVYWLFREENYTGGYLLAGFTLPFYAGDVIGARRSAEIYNDSRRLERVSQWIDETDAR
jgi:putative membrane protein insertion efficiency factor